MGNDPGYPDDSDGGSIESKRTRLVRPAGTEFSSTPPADDQSTPISAGGAVIGRTRLVGDQGQAPGTSQVIGGIPPASPGGTIKMGGEAKTRFIREGTVDTDPVAGWVVIIKGPGRGGFRPVLVGMNSVGRASGQRVCLDFGDEAISREEHAFITYDDETRTFYIQHGGKSNVVRLNSKPVLMPTEMVANDIIRIGNTSLRFVPCCGPDFSWTNTVDDA